MYWDAWTKTQVLGKRCPTKHAFSHIFIRIQVGNTVQYIDILKSYLNLNKYMVKKRVLWAIYFQVLWFWCMHPSTMYYGKSNIWWRNSNKILQKMLSLISCGRILSKLSYLFKIDYGSKNILKKKQTSSYNFFYKCIPCENVQLRHCSISIYANF